jgi:C1A family cysteine protease
MLTASAAVPASKDLREKWWEIGDQGATGSCVGWATADSVLRWHFVNAGRFSKEDHLSVRYVWMAAKETDEFSSRPTTFIERDGTSLKAALDVARKYGVVADSEVPFKPTKLSMKDTLTFYALASQLKIASYFNLGWSMPMPNKIVMWRMWLSTRGPVLTRLNVDSTWMNATKTQGKLDVYDASILYGGHAVALVGYTQDRFIVRNSWGTGWGDNGFAYASIPYAQSAFTESYGVNL